MSSIEITWESGGSSPTVEVDPTTVEGASRVYGALTGTAASFDVTGNNLTANVTVAVQANSDFEVSTSESSGYGPSVTLTQSNGSASGTVYVRPTSTANVGCKSENLTVSSTGATSVTVPVSGVVTPAVGVSASSAGGTFTWSSVAGATGYQLSIWSGSGGAGYTRVEGLTDGVLPDGDYVILDKDHDAIMAQKVSGQKYYGYSSPVFSETTLEATCIGNANIWTFVKSGSYYSIQNKGNSKYVTCSSASNNNMGEADTATTVWAISMVDGNFRIKPSTLETSLQWNGSYTRFSNYANSGQDDLHLYKLGCAAGTIDGGASQPLGGVSVSSGVVVGGLEAETTYNYSLTVVGPSCDMVTTGTFTTTALSGSLTVSGETGLTGMKTTTGSAGATAGSFAVRGANLTERVRVQAPAGFAVSLSENSGYSADGGYVDIPKATAEAGNTTVYVRLTGGAVASGTLNVTVSSSGASTVNVEVSGTTYAAPGLSSHSGSATPTVGGENVSVNVSGLKTGSGTMTYSLTAQEGLASGSDYTWNPANGTVTFIPHKAGEFTFTVTVANAAGDAAGTETYTWTVTASHPAGTASGGTTVQFPGTWNSYATSLTTVQDTKFGNGDYYHTPALYFTGDEWFKTWRNSTYYSRGYFDQSEGYWLAANLSGHVLDTWNKNGDNIKLCVTETGGGFTPTGAGYYTFRGYYNSGEDKVYCVAMFTAERPVTVSSASDNHATAGTGNVTVTANLSGTPSTETVYLRYAVNGDWKTPVTMTGSGATRTGTIPGQTGDKTVQWYIFTSPHGAATSNPDLCTLEGLKSGTTNFAYVPMSLTADASVTAPTTTYGRTGDAASVTVTTTGLSGTITVSKTGNIQVKIGSGAWGTGGSMAAAGEALQVRLTGAAVAASGSIGTVTLTCGSYSATVTVNGTVNPAVPTVTKTADTGLSASGVTLNATVNAGGASTTVKFAYGTSAGSYGAATTVTTVAAGETAKAVYKTLSGLLPGTTYYYKWTVQNGAAEDGTAEGSFTTSVAVPTVGTLTHTGETTTGAVLGGTVSSAGGGTVTAGGVEYRKGASDDWTQVPLGSAPGSSPFTVTVGGLEAETTYQFRAYAVNEAGTGYSDTGTFTTADCFGGAASFGTVTVSVVNTVAKLEWASLGEGTTYALSVWKSGGSSTVIDEDFSGWTSTSYSYDSTSQSGSGGTWSYVRCSAQPTSAASGDGTAGRVQMEKNNGKLYLPAVDNPASITVAFSSGGSGGLILKKASDDSVVHTFSPGSGVTSQSQTLSETGTGVAYYLQAGSNAIYLYDVEVVAESKTYAYGSSSGPASASSGVEVSGLTANTAYKYEVTATAAGGCELKTGEQTFTTASAAPTLSVSPATQSLASVAPTAGTPVNMSVSGGNLGTAVTVGVPAEGAYEVSTDGTAWGASVTLTPTAGTLSATTVQVRLKAALSAGDYNGVTLTAASLGVTATATLNGTVAPNGGCLSRQLRGPTDGSKTALSGNLYTYSLGDWLAYEIYGSINCDTTGWTVEYGVGDDDDVTDASWTWHALDGTHYVTAMYDDPERWWKSGQNDIQFTATGTKYVTMRFSKDGCVYHLPGGTAMVAGGGNPDATAWFTVAAIDPPTGVSAAGVASDTSVINLGWTKNAAGHDVMVVRADYGAGAPTLTQGTSYSGSWTAGGNTYTVVYKGASTTGYQDTGLVGEKTYKYWFYSVNNDYYSTAVAINNAKPTAPNVSITGTLDFGTVAPGQSPTLTLTIVNEGNGVYVVDNLISSNPKFAVSAVTPATVPAKVGDTPGTATFTVTYTPTAETASESATLTLTSLQSLNPSSLATKTATVTGACACFAGDTWGDGAVTAVAGTTSIDFGWEAIDFATEYRLSVWTGGAGLEDTLTRATTGVANGSTAYAAWSGKNPAGGSDAVYKGNSAGGNNSIQLRSGTTSGQTAHSGIITTTTGGKASKVTVSWNSETGDEKVLDIYGKSTAYSAVNDLWNASLRGTKIGSITFRKGAYAALCETELEIDGDYEYIGIRVNDGAVYLDSVTITWGGNEYVGAYDAAGKQISSLTLAERVTGLEEDTEYGWKLWAVGYGTCKVEEEGTVTTGADPRAPEFAVAGPVEVTVTAGETATYENKASGYPKAMTYSVISGSGATVSSEGVFSYATSASGVWDFTVQAANGTAPAATYDIRVKAVPAAPVIGSTLTAGVGSLGGTVTGDSGAGVALEVKRYASAEDASADGTGTLGATVGVSGSAGSWTFSDTGRDGCTTYAYRAWLTKTVTVGGVSVELRSAGSEPVSGKTLLGAPTMNPNPPVGAGTTLTLAWNPVPGATRYEVQVSSDDSFTQGSGGTLVEEHFASGSPSGWTISSGTGTYNDTPYMASDSGHSLKFDSNSDYAITPTFAAGATKVSFWAYGNGGSGSSFTIQANDGPEGGWEDVETVPIDEGAQTCEVSLEDHPTATRLKFTFSRVKNCGLDDVVVSGTASDGTIVHTATLSGGTCETTATGLTPATRYWYRVTAYSDNGCGGVSDGTRTSGSALTADAPQIQVRPDGWNFGEVDRDYSKEQSFTVKNTGSKLLTIRGIRLVGEGGVASTEFLVTAVGSATGLDTATYTPGTAVTVAAGASTTVKVKFAPESDGPKAATLRFDCNGYNANGGSTDLSVYGNWDVALTGSCHDPSTEPPTVYEVSVTDGAGRKNTVTDHAMARGAGPNPAVELPGASAVQLSVLAWHYNKMYSGDAAEKQATWTLKKDGTVVSDKGGTSLAGRPFSGRATVTASNGKECTRYTAVIPALGAGNAEEGEYTVEFTAWDSTGLQQVSAATAFTPPEKGWLLDDFTRGDRSATDAGGLGRGWTVSATDAATGGAGSAVIHGQQLELYGPNGTMSGSEGRIAVVRDMNDWGYGKTVEGMESTLSWGFHFRTGAKTGAANGSTATAGLFVLGATGSDWLGSEAGGAAGYAVALADNKVSLVQFGAGLKAGSTITTLKPAGEGKAWAYEEGTIGKTLAVRVDFAPGQEAIAEVQEAVAPKLRLYVKETAETGGNPLEECGDGDKVCEVELADAPAGALRYAGMVWAHGKAQLGDKTGGMFDDIHMPCGKEQEIPMAFEVVDEDTDAPEFDGFRMAVTAASEAAATWVGMANAIQASGAYNNGLTVTGVVHDASGIWADGEGTAPAWELYVADPGDETWGDPVATGTPALTPAGSGAGADVAVRITIGAHVLPNTAGKDVLLSVEACDHDHDRADDSLWGVAEFQFTLCSETPAAPAWATVERDGAEMAVLRWAHAVHQTNLVVRSDTAIEPHETPVQGLDPEDYTEGTELEGLGEVVYFGEGDDHLSGTWMAREVVVAPGSTNYFAVFGVNSDPTGCYFSEPTFPSDWSWKENGSVVYATGTGAASGTPCAPSAMDPARDAVRSNSWPMTTLVYEPGEGIDAFAYRTKVTAPGDGDPAGKAVLFNAEERNEMGSGWGGAWTENASGTWKIHDTSLPVGETDYPEPAGNKLYWQDASGSAAGLARMERTLGSPARGDFFVAALVNYQYRGDGKWVNIVLLDESDNVIVSFGKQGGAGVSANAAILVPEGFSGESNGDQTKSVPEYNTSQATFQLAPEQDATAAGYIGNDYVIVGQVSKSENRFRMWAYYAGPIPETPTDAQKKAAMGVGSDGNVSSVTRAQMLARSQIPQIFADPDGGACATNSVVASWYLDGLGAMVGNVAKIRLEAGSDAGGSAPVLGHVYFDEVRFGSNWEELFLFDDPEVYNFSFERQNGEDDEGHPKWQVSDGALAHGQVALTATFDLFHRTGIESADFTIMNSNKVALLHTAATPTPSLPGDYATGTLSDPVGMSSEESGSAGRSQWTLSATGVALPTNWIALDSNYVVQVHLTTAGGKENTVWSASETGGASATNLFFGEYGEGRSWDKYLELYNATGRDVDLSQYYIGRLLKDQDFSTTYYGLEFHHGENDTRSQDSCARLCLEDDPKRMLPSGETVVLLNYKRGAAGHTERLNNMKAALDRKGYRYLVMTNEVLDSGGGTPYLLITKEVFDAPDAEGNFAHSVSNKPWLDACGQATSIIGDTQGRYIMSRKDSASILPRTAPNIINFEEWDYRRWEKDADDGPNYLDFISTAGAYDRDIGLGGNMEFTVFDDDVLAPELSGEAGANGMELSAGSGLLATTAGTRDLVMAAWSFTNTESVALAADVWSGSAMKDNAKLTCSENLGTVARLVKTGDAGVTGAEFNGVVQNKLGELYFKCNAEGYNITKEDEAWIGFETDMASATERGVSFWYATGSDGFKEGHVEVSLNGVDWWTPEGWGLELDSTSGTGGASEFIEFSKSLEFTTDDGVTLAIPRTTPHLRFRVVVSQRKDADGSFRLDAIQVHGVADELVVTDQQLVGAQPVFHAKVRDASGVDTVSATFKSGLEGVEGAGAEANKDSSVSGAYTNFTWALAVPLGTDQVQKWFEASEEGQTHLTVSVKDKDDDRPDDQSELDGHFGAIRVMDDDDEAPEIKMTSMKPRMGGVLGEWYAEETNGVATVGLPARHANGIAASAIQARAGNEVPKPVKWSAYGDGTYGYRQTGWQADSKYWYVRLETLVPTAESGSEGGATFTITNITFWTKSSRTGPTGCIANFVAGFTGTDALDRPTGGTTSEIGSRGFLGEGAEGWTESTADTWAKQTIPLMGGDAIVLGGTTKNELQLLGQGAEKMAGAWHIYDLRIEGTVRYANGESEEVTYVTDHGLATGATLGSLQGNIWDASGLASATYTLKKGTSTLVPESDLTFTAGSGTQAERRAGATTEAAGAFSVSLAGIRAGYADLELGDYLGTVKAEDADADRTVTTAVASGTGRRDGTVTENVDSMSIEGDFGFTVVDQDVKGPDAPTVATGDAQTKGVYATRPASGATVHWTNNPVFAVVLAGEAVDAAPTAAETDGTTEAGRTWRSEHGWLDTVQNGTSGIAEYRVTTGDLAAAGNYAASNTIQKAASGFAVRGLANGGFEGAGGFGVDGGWIVTNSNDKIDTGSHHGDKGTRSLLVGNNRRVRQILAFSNANHRTVTVSGGMWYRKNTDKSRAHMVVEAYADPRDTTGTPVGTIDSGALGNNIDEETWTEYTFGPLSIGDGSVNCLVVTLYSTGAANRFDDVELTLALGEGTQPAVAYVATAAGQGLDVAKWLFAVDADDDRVDDAEMGQAVPFYTAYDCTPPTAVAFIGHGTGASADTDDPTTQFDLTWLTSGVGPDNTTSPEYAAIPASNKRGVNSLSPWGTFRVYYRTYDPVALAAAATEAGAGSVETYLYQTLVRGPADGWGGSGADTLFYRNPELGWKHAENGDEIEDTTATVTAAVVDGKRKYSGWNAIGTEAQQTVRLYDLEFDQEYLVVVVGVDKAGNEGPVTETSWATNNTIKFSITRGWHVPKTEARTAFGTSITTHLTNDVVSALRWTAAGLHEVVTTNETVVTTNWEGSVTKDYDLLSWDARNFRESPDNDWKLIGSVRSDWFVDDGGPTNRGAIRFYRASYKDRWKKAVTNATTGQVMAQTPLVSEEVYAQTAIPLRSGWNFVALHGVPYTNTLRGVFGGTETFPGGGHASLGTCIDFYDPATGEARSDRYWLDPDGLWHADNDTTGEVDLSDTLLDANLFTRAFSIELPNDIPTNYVAGTNYIRHGSGSHVQIEEVPYMLWKPILQVPTNGFSRLIESGTENAPKYNIVALRLPVATHPSKMNLIESGFTPGDPWEADQIYTIDPVTREPGHSCYCDSEGNWKFVSGEAVPGDYFKPNDVLVIVSKNGPDWTWRYNPAKFYTLPNRHMQDKTE